MLQADAEYLILVQGFGGETGPFNLTVATEAETCDIGSQTAC